MIKVYFAPNWGLTSEQMVNDYIKQTPKELGVWDDITYTLNPDEADYLIIQDSCDFNLMNKFPINKRLYFSREALTPNIIDSYRNQVVNCSFWDEQSILWTKWWYPNKSSGGINKTYDYLLNEKPIIKDKNLTIENIKNILSKDNYEKRIPALKKARQLILNNYNVWPLIKNIITQLN
jgi:hypothetical protein